MVYSQKRIIARKERAEVTEFDFLSDSTEQTTTRYVTFITQSLHRFDLAIMSTNRFYGKKIVIDMQKGISAVIGPDDVAEPGYLQATFRLSEEEAAELAAFLEQVVGPVNFSDT